MSQIRDKELVGPCLRYQRWYEASVPGPRRVFGIYDRAVFVPNRSVPPNARANSIQPCLANYCPWVFCGAGS
jgi:hypothetical protein